MCFVVLSRGPAGRLFCGLCGDPGFSQLAAPCPWVPPHPRVLAPGCKVKGRPPPLRTCVLWQGQTSGPRAFILKGKAGRCRHASTHTLLTCLSVPSEAWGHYGIPAGPPRA